MRESGRERGGGERDRDREGGGERNDRWVGERERVWRQRRGIVFWLRFDRNSFYNSGPVSLLLCSCDVFAALVNSLDLLILRKRSRPRSVRFLTFRQLCIHTPSIAFGTFLQTLPDLVAPLKGHSLSPRSCTPTWSAPSEMSGY